MSWSMFLNVHWGAISAADFFTVENFCNGGLFRCIHGLPAFARLSIMVGGIVMNYGGISHART